MPNKEYIDALAKTVGKAAAEKTVNDFYSEKMAAKMTPMAAPDPTNIKQILNKDVWIWAYESKWRDLYDTDADQLVM